MKTYSFPDGFKIYSVKEYKDWNDTMEFQWFSFALGMVMAVVIVWAF